MTSIELAIKAIAHAEREGIPLSADVDGETLGARLRTLLGFAYQADVNAARRAVGAAYGMLRDLEQAMERIGE